MKIIVKRPCTIIKDLAHPSVIAFYQPIFELIVRNLAGHEVSEVLSEYVSCFSVDHYFHSPDIQVDCVLAVIYCELIPKVQIKVSNCKSLTRIEKQLSFHTLLEKLALHTISFFNFIE